MVVPFFKVVIIFIGHSTLGQSLALMTNVCAVFAGGHGEIPFIVCPFSVSEIHAVLLVIHPLTPSWTFRCPSITEDRSGSLFGYRARISLIPFLRSPVRAVKFKFGTCATFA
jgi:hypothetical protein